MKIFSFDCAVKTLAFCCVDYDEKCNDELKKITMDIKKINDELKKNVNSDSKNANADSKNVIDKDNIKQLMNDINYNLDNRIKLNYINVFDLIPSKKMEKCNFHDVLINLKYVLHCIDNQIGRPDVILIEYQMNANDKSRGISRYIEGYYTELQEPTEKIAFAFNAYPIQKVNLEKKNNKVFIINPNLKNMYQIDPTEKGSYSYYIQKYSNKSANKKHTTHNFIYYLNQIGKANIIKDVKIKLDDAADAFMMAYSWLIKFNYI
jgi:hypothetical protein